MTADKQNAGPEVLPADRKLIRIKGVRAKPGGVVRLAELTDGWATFPDPGGGARRWQRVGLFVLVPLFVALYLSERGVLPFGAQGILALVVLAVIILLVVSNEVSQDVTILARWRIRREATIRTGGRAQLWRVILTQGRARTVGEVNILLSSLGRADPVFSTRRVRHAQVRKHWWRTVVDLELTNNKHVSYRVVGVRAPSRLARAFDPGRYPA